MGFEQHSTLFSQVALVRYVPPISGPGGAQQLPESPQGIEEEMKKQESLLAELHMEISSGVAVSKAREEQLWEQQRIVTQLKRNLRMAKSRQVSKVPPEPEQELDWEEELNFNLQTPAVVEEAVEVVEVQEADANKGITSSPEDTLTKEKEAAFQPPMTEPESPEAPVAPVAATAVTTDKAVTTIVTVTPPSVSPLAVASAPPIPSPPAEPIKKSPPALPQQAPTTSTSPSTYSTLH